MANEMTDGKEYLGLAANPLFRQLSSEALDEISRLMVKESHKAGDTIFLAIDSSGSTSGPTGGFTGAQAATKTPGHILRMVFLQVLPYTNNYIPAKPVNNREATVIYPNPTSKYIHVLIKSGLHKPFFVQLYDISGRIVLQHTTDQDNFTLDVGNFRAGIYILRLYNGYDVNINTQKIIIQ